MADKRAAVNSITQVRSATVRIALDAPMRFGEHIVSHREYVIVSICAGNEQGIGFGLTRDAPVAELIRRFIAPHYEGSSGNEPQTAFCLALRRHPTVLSSGLGLRALSVADLAAWDVAAKLAGQSVMNYLGGSPADLQQIALVGFPPTRSPRDVAAEVLGLWECGWRRFKLPIAPSLELTRSRLDAARGSAEGSRVMLDAAWSWDSVDEAAAYLSALGDGVLEWVEDPFMPGDARKLAQLRERVEVPVAAGDEQGGNYFPEALLTSRAVDIVRLDATCVGGVTMFRPLLELAREARIRSSTHIYPHFHTAILCGLSASDSTVEQGFGNGVDPMSEFARLTEGLGFGISLDIDWLRSQNLDDPDGIFAA